MHKHLFQHVITQFEAALFKKYPAAARAPKTEQPRVQGIVYNFSSAPKLYSFLLLQGHDHSQDFTVELAQARVPRFPWKADCDYDDETCQSLPTFPLRVRLGHVMGYNHDYWWPACSTKDPPLGAGEKVWLKFWSQKIDDKTWPPDIVAKSVKNLLKNLQQFGEPFLKECAELK